jgi:hypothetical protein
MSIINLIEKLEKAKSLIQIQEDNVEQQQSIKHLDIKLDGVIQDIHSLYKTLQSMNDRLLRIQNLLVPKQTKRKPSWFGCCFGGE